LNKALSLPAPEVSFDLDVLDELIGYHLQRAAIDCHQTFMHQPGSKRITPKQFSAIVLISANRDMSQADLGRVLAMDRATTTALIDKLEGKDRVVRNPSKVDRRRHALRLSNTGTKLLTTMKEHAKVHSEQLTSALDDQERDTLISLLRRVRASVEGEYALHALYGSGYRQHRATARRCGQHASRDELPAGERRPWLVRA
jgi:DNA-binding MarR family transcriptional regulator